MLEVAPHFAAVDQVVAAAWAPFGQAGALDPAPFVSPVSDFYLTNPIARASVTMAECSKLASAQAQQGKTGTHG